MWIPEILDPLETAGRVGLSLAGNIGEMAFIELELAYATKLLPRFSDDPVIRRNQNTLLYWQYGYYKSKILEVFSQTIPEALKAVDITSMTLEKIFGSIDEKKRRIIEPAFTNDVHFVIVSELTALLGQRDAMRQFANTMNLVLENEKVVRQILKLGHEQIDEAQLSELKKKGVAYDFVKGELSYSPNICVFAATRPLENRYYTYLNGSGHFSRYHVIQHRVTDEEASKHLHEDYKLNKQTLDQLTQINAALSNVRVKKMLRPSESLMKPIYDDIEALVKDEIAEKPRLKLADVISPRLKGDLIRELVSHAFPRNASLSGLQNIEELRYTQEDVDFIRERLYHFIEFAVNPIIAASYSRLTEGSKRDQVKTRILVCLSDGAEWHIDRIMKAVEPLKISPALVYIALNELIKEGKVRKPRRGYYQIVKSVE